MSRLFHWLNIDTGHLHHANYVWCKCTSRLSGNKRSSFRLTKMVTSHTYRIICFFCPVCITKGYKFRFNLISLVLQ